MNSIQQVSPHQWTSQASQGNQWTSSGGASQSPHQPLVGPKQAPHQWTSPSGSQTPHRPLVGPKQGAVLLKQLAKNYKRPAQPPRRGLRGSQSHPNKHYAGLGGLAKKQCLENCLGPPGPSPDPVLWFPGGDAECGVTEGGL